MVATEKFSVDSNYCTILFPHQHRSLHKTASILWGQLLDDNRFSDDGARLSFWYKRIVHRSNYWSDIGQFTHGAALQRFIDAALNAVTTDGDLSIGQDEYKKLLLDPMHARLQTLGHLPVVLRRNDFPIHAAAYDLYWNLRALDTDYQSELLYYQEARLPLAYFIRQVVKHGPEFQEGALYPAVHRLIEAGAKKPYLLWEACQELTETKPSIIPTLLLRADTTALGYGLLWDIPISENAAENREIVRRRLLASALELLLDSIKVQHLPEQRQAELVFQSLLRAFIRTHRVRGQDDERQRSFRSIDAATLKELQAVFTSATQQGMYYPASERGARLLFPLLLKHLLTLAVAFEPIDKRKNHVLRFPFIKLDILAWLLELRLSKEYVRSAITDGLDIEIAEAFVDSYVGAMNTERIASWDYFKNVPARKLPIWSASASLLEAIPWHKVLAQIPSVSLQEFLAPVRLRLRKSKNRFDEHNRFTAQKIRTHVFILIEAFNGLYREAPAMAAKGVQVKQILLALQSTIVSTVTLHSVDDSERRRIDIFDDFFEVSYSPGENKELLPALGSVMNKFTEDGKRDIIKELPKAKQLERALKLLKYASSENDRQLLLESIGAHEIAAYLESDNTSLSSIQFMLQEFAQTPELTSKAEETLHYWNKTVVKKRGRDEHKIAAYRVALIIEYQKGNEGDIDAVSDPTLQQSSAHRNFSVQEEKDFYRALIFFRARESEMALNIFNRQLQSAGESRPVLALNAFAAKLQLADSATLLDKKSKLYQEALDEWQTFQQRLSKEANIGYIMDGVQYNQLRGYEGLHNDAGFDAIYNTLEREIALRPDFVALRLENLMRRDMRLQAERLFEEAKNFHRLSDGKLPDSLLALESIVETKKAIEELKEQYRIILSKSPQTLVGIVPESINKYDTLPEALLFELVSAAKRMLANINSISDIKQEDKYSDLLQLALNARLSMYGWSISPTRSGQPFSKAANLGEIDFAIFSKNERLCVCEAMILKGKNTVETTKHNRKVFNYDHSRLLFFMLVYYKGNKFVSDWTKYKADVEQTIQFSNGYEMQSSMLEDLSTEFGDDSIRVGKGERKNGAVLYHLFINIEHFLPLP